MKKKIDLSNVMLFLSIGIFTVIANILLVFSFYYSNSMSAEAFASLNFGLYVIALFGVISESISKWLTIELSRKKPKEFKKFLLSVYYEATPYFLILIFLITFGLIIAFPQYLVLLLICNCIGLIIYVYMYLRAWINSLESYVFLGVLLLGIPFARLISSIFLVELNYIWMFWFVLFAGIGMVILSIIFLKSKYKDFFKLERYKDEKIIDEKTIFLNSLVQLAVNIFWIADGIILKALLPTEVYNTYVIYAYIYKFPFFISASFVLVILGKNVLSKTKLKEFSKSLLTSLAMILALFGGLILFDTIFEGFILNILGYGQYITENLSLFFGAGWLFQTLNYLLFSSILKTTKDPQTINGIALSYALSYSLLLVVFRANIFYLTYAILSHGILYFVMNSILQYRLLNNTKA